MKGLLFLSRLALICNVLFLLCLALQRTHDFINIEGVKGTVIVLGWFLAPFINFPANIWWFSRLIRKQPVNLPTWLGVTNLLFLCAQIFVHFIMPS
jgi:hypothetical protein